MSKWFVKCHLSTCVHILKDICIQNVSCDTCVKSRCQLMHMSPWLAICQVVSTFQKTSVQMIWHVSTSTSTFLTTKFEVCSVTVSLVKMCQRFKKSMSKLFCHVSFVNLRQHFKRWNTKCVQWHVHQNEVSIADTYVKSQCHLSRFCQRVKKPISKSNQWHLCWNKMSSYIFNCQMTLSRFI